MARQRWGFEGGKARPHGGGQLVSGVGGEGDKHSVRRGWGCSGDGEVTSTTLGEGGAAVVMVRAG